MPRWLKKLLLRHGFLLKGRKGIWGRKDFPEYGVFIEFPKEDGGFEFRFSLAVGDQTGGDLGTRGFVLDPSWINALWTRSGEPVSPFDLADHWQACWTDADEELFTRVFEDRFMPWIDTWTAPDWLLQVYLHRNGEPVSQEVKAAMENHVRAPIKVGETSMGLAYLYACRQDWDKAMFWSEGMKHLLTNLRQEVAERRFRPIPIEDAALALGYKRISSGRSAKYEDTPSLFPFSHLVVNGRDAQKEWATRVGIEGMTPVIMGGVEDLELLCRLIDESEQSPEQIIEDAGRIDIQAWFESRVAADPDYYSVEPGEWLSDSEKHRGFSLHLDELTQRPKRKVVLGLFPTECTWEIPAHTKFGGWNECPEPAFHVALHKRWNRIYGSEIVCLSSEVIECSVRTPPKSKEAALLLAREQFLYCPDLVHQGSESIERLAAALLNSKTWFFWWD